MKAPEPARSEGRKIRRRLHRSMISGLAIVVPVLITLFVLQFALGMLLDSVGPLADLLQGFAEIGDQLAANIVAIALLLVLIFAVGFAAESGNTPGHLEATFENFMSSIPGLGAVYSSFNEMSQLLIDKDTESFQEVKLVEYPVEDSYCVAFVTAETSDNIRTATDHSDMTTLYLPMAPNPVMGGFVVHVADEKVYDVDMTVEEGMRSVVTSGIAVNEEHDSEVSAPQAAESPQLSGTVPDNDDRTQ